MTRGWDRMVYTHIHMYEPYILWDPCLVGTTENFPISCVSLFLIPAVHNSVSPPNYQSVLVQYGWEACSSCCVEHGSFNLCSRASDFIENVRKLKNARYRTVPTDWLVGWLAGRTSTVESSLVLIVTLLFNASGGRAKRRNRWGGGDVRVRKLRGLPTGVTSRITAIRNHTVTKPGA